MRPEEKLNFAPIEEEVTVQLKFPTDLEMKEQRDEASRRLQAERYPSSQEIARQEFPNSPQAWNRGPGAKGVEGARPWSEFFMPAVGTSMGPTAMAAYPQSIGRPTTDAYRTAVSDLYGVATFLPRAAWSPWKTAKSIAGADEAGEQMRQEVGRAYNEGDYPYVMRQGLLNMLPMGSSVGRMVDESAVHPAEGTGHVAAAIAAPKVAKLTNKVYLHPLQSIKNVAGAIGSGYTALKEGAIDAANRSTAPHMQYFKAVRPKNMPLNAAEALEGAEPEINRGAEIIGRDVKTIFDMDEALDAALRERIQQARVLKGTGSSVAYDGTAIADDIIAKVDKNPQVRAMKIRDPEAHQAIVDWVNETYRGKKFDIEDVDTLRRAGNAKDAPFWNKLPGGRMNASVNQAVNKIETDVIRDHEYTKLDQAVGTGTGFKEVNLAIRDILKTQEYLDRRWNVELRQAVQNLPQQIGKLAALGKFGQAAKQLLKGNYAGAGVDALTGLGEAGLVDFFKDLNSTNGQIASAFRRSRATQRPIMMTPSSTRQALPSAGSGPVLPSTETGHAPGSLSAQWQWERPDLAPIKTRARDPKTGRFIEAEVYTGDVPKIQNPVERGPSGRMGIAWREAVKKFEAENPQDKSGSYPMRQKFGETGKLGEDYHIGRDPLTGHFKKILIKEADRLRRRMKEDKDK